jgi:hypothetical protein
MPNVGYCPTALASYLVIWVTLKRAAYKRRYGMRLFLVGCILILGIGVVGCSKRPYVVCRGEAYCTVPMTHDEAMHASQLKKAWEMTICA